MVDRDRVGRAAQGDALRRDEHLLFRCRAAVHQPVEKCRAGVADPLQVVVDGCGAGDGSISVQIIRDLQRINEIFSRYACVVIRDCVIICAIRR